MAGEGLIWSALGQGIANAGSTMSQYMFKDIAAEEAAKEKRELLQERLAATERENARNRELRSEIAESRKSSGGGGGTGGLDISEMAPGGKLASMAANKMGKSEAEYKKDWEAFKSGDKSGYEVEETEYGDFGEENKVKKLPKGFEDEFKAKQKALGNLQEQYALAGKFDDVAKGRQIEFGTKMGQTAFDQPEVADKAGQAVAVAGGKPLVNVEGGEKYNQYTGKSETTPVGKSQITENVAQAGEATKRGDAAETKAERQDKAKGQTTLDLERQVKNAQAILHEGLGVSPSEANAELQRVQKKAAAGDPEAKARLEALTPAIQKLNTVRAKLDAWEAKTAAPDTAEKPVAPPPTVKALPAGAVLIGKSGGKNVYQLPDGSRYLQK